MSAHGVCVLQYSYLHYVLGVGVVEKHLCDHRAAGWGGEGGRGHDECRSHACGNGMVCVRVCSMY